MIIKTFARSDSPMTPPAQDPNFFCPLKARVHQPELWGLRLACFAQKARLLWNMCSLSTELDSHYLCGACLIFRFQWWRREKEKWDLFSWFVWFFFPHSRLPSKSHHTVCSSAGPEPRRWPPAGTSNAAWVDRHNLAMLLKEAEVGIGDEGRAENLSITSISWTDVQTTREDWETSVYL